MSDPVPSDEPTDPGQVASATPPAPGRSRRLSDRRLAVAFISPALLLLLAMSVFPLLWALYLSFTDYSATRGRAGATSIWFKNYIDILTSPEVHLSGADDVDLRRRGGRPADRPRLRHRLPDLTAQARARSC